MAKRFELQYREAKGNAVVGAFMWRSVFDLLLWFFVVFCGCVCVLRSVCAAAADDVQLVCGESDSLNSSSFNALQSSSWGRSLCWW